MEQKTKSHFFGGGEVFCVSWKSEPPSIVYLPLVLPALIVVSKLFKKRCDYDDFLEGGSVSFFVKIWGPPQCLPATSTACFDRSAEIV